MTLRLVGLMSIVLLLSLAAFGLLMAHYQDQVMEEVARTASAVGKATLRTMDFGENAMFVAEGGGTWVASDEEKNVFTEDVREKIQNRGTVLIRRVQRTGDGGLVEHIISGEIDSTCVEDGTGETPCVAGRFRCPEGADETLCREFEDRIKAHITRSGEELEARLYVDLEEIRVDPDPADGKLVMHIPTFHPAAVDDGHAASHVVRDHDPGPPAGEEIFRLAHGDVIRLPIEVDDYDTLFKSIRGRSLFLFLGVFVVGVALSAGLASRFTQPIRRLDAGIRRLSEGDLEVQVEVQGDDEIGRLGTAFNDMAHKLKESRDRNREMVRREKLSALGGLAAGVAHDVRNPLHSIGLTLQHLRETCRPEADERGAEFDHSLDIIRGEIRRLDGLVSNFLRFSRSERRERQSVNLADLLQETARLIRKEAEWRGVEIGLDVNPVAPSISADAESIRASILNLVLNSFNAMPDGGRLDLALRVQHDELVVEVSDTGEGIPEEDREKVFEFAYSTREGGSGLGLAMVHQCIVEEHGGKVSMDSRPGHGTTVRLALPIRPPERTEAS